MALSGFAAGAGSDELQRLMTEAFMRQRVATEQQMQRERMQLERDALSERVRGDEADRGLRTRALDQADTARREGANRTGVEDMERQHGLMQEADNDRALDEFISTLPEGPGRRAVTLRRRGVTGVNAADVETPEERTAREAGDLKRVTAIAQAQRGPAQPAQPQRQEWVMRGGKPTPIQPGTAQPGDTPYDEVGERQRAGQNALPPDQASQARADILSAAKALRTHKGLGSYTGTRFNLSHGLGWYDDPIAGTDAAGAKSLHDNLTALLALPNLEKLRGPLSDKDIEFIKAASSKLQKNMPDEAFAAELDGIIQKLEAGGSLPASPGGGGAAPRPEDSALSELERRRRARGGR